MKDNNIARQIMEEFVARTGLLEAGSGPSRRYLWTDAFAVCNYLALYQQDGSEQHLDLAVDLLFVLIDYDAVLSNYSV